MVGRRALVVEDAPELRHLVGAVLERAGFHVTPAGCGADALRDARLLHPDLVVLDLGLPDLDGIEVCRRLRTFSDAYVLILTGRSDDVDVTTGLAAGADDFVTKPCSPAELRARVRALEQRPRRARRAPAAYDELASDLPLVDVLRRTLTRPTPTDHGLVVHHQPKLAAADGRVVGVEALVRLDHPDGTRLSPDRFVSLAEHAGLMAELTGSVLTAALRDLVGWRAEGLELGAAVNISTSDLADPRFGAAVLEQLEAHDVAPERLTLEVTEDHLMEDRPNALARLAELRRAGVKVAIDDYGTGRASLAYLRDLPADELKLDRSFVTGIAEDPRLALIVSSTVALAHALGLSVVAEGVDAVDDLEALRQLDVDTVQGFLFHRPAPAAEIAQWCRSRSGGGRSGSVIDLRFEAGPELRGGLTIS